MEAHVSLAPEKVFELAGFTVTNSMLASGLVFILLVIFALFVRRGSGLIPGRLQIMVEMIMQLFLDQLTQSLGNEKKARKLLPMIMTFFLFILIGNLFALMPLVSALMIEGDHGPLMFFRVPTTDYSLTIAFALMVVLGSNILAFSISPIRHISTFIRIGSILKARTPMEFFMGVIDFGLGLMEFVSEVAKVISLATRLFGNIFAGEVVVAIIMSLMFWTAYFLPIPFLVLTTIGGIAQAFVFCFLAIISFSSHVNHASGEAH